MSTVIQTEESATLNGGNGTAAPVSDTPIGSRRASYNPATGELLGYVALVGREGVDAALHAAHEAQREWATWSPRRRAQTLRQFGHALVADADAVARLVSMEQGKPVPEALSMELMSVLPQLRWLTSQGVKLLEGGGAALVHPFFSAKEARYRFEPLGVIAVISPWNYPFAIPTIQLLTALMAGNGVVMKPSPFTPLIGQKIAELARQTDMPAGLLSVLHIEDSDAPYLTSHPSVNKIIFTGSVATGRKVMASAAQVPTPVVLELGGKDAAIVAPDADLKRAVMGIVWYALSNSGQTCASVERAYVHTDLYDQFVEEAVALVRTLHVGEGTQTGNEIGPLTNERQLQIVESQVEEAKAKGARVLVGGHRLPGNGYFYAPTILVNVTPDMQLMTEESFGPLLPIVRVNSVEEAIEAANSLPYALVGSLWTRDGKQALEFAGRVRAGAVNVNDHAFHFAEPGAGWGGLGESGFGRTHGAFGLLEMVNTKFVSADMRTGALEPWWYPYDENMVPFLRSAIRFLYGPTARRPWALLSLLLNPRLWQRTNLVQFVAAIRKWL